MSDARGKFVWYELMTTDTKAAEKFYREAVGWDAKDAGMPDMSYTIFSAGGTGVGGMMEIPPRIRDAGGHPGWMAHVAVDDVDASAAQAKQLGGSIHREPTDIPGIGRFSIIADPQGATLSLFKGLQTEDWQPAKPRTPGHGGWHELHTIDREAAFTFYSKLFGWTKGEAFDMGPMGVYQLFPAGDAVFGGMMNNPDMPGGPTWLYYFNVDAIDAAKARVEKAGGQILMGPHEVPGGSWILQCRDPQGGMFALIEPPRS